MAEVRTAERGKAAFSVETTPQQRGEPEKKPFLERRGIAVALLVIAILGGTLFGTHRSIAAERLKVERKFSTGVLYDGYSIESDLSDRMEYAGILVKIARQEGLNTEAAQVADAINALDAATGTHEKYEANRSLTDAVEELYAAHQTLQDLNESTAAKMEEYYTNFSSTGDTIAREANAYNELVAEFNEKTLGVFPNGTLARLTGVRELEAFR